jgi:hypothetical protein
MGNAIPEVPLFNLVVAWTKDEFRMSLRLDSHQRNEAYVIFHTRKCGDGLERHADEGFGKLDRVQLLRGAVKVLDLPKIIVVFHQPCVAVPEAIARRPPSVPHRATAVRRVDLCHSGSLARFCGHEVNDERRKPLHHTTHGEHIELELSHTRYVGSPRHHRMGQFAAPHDLGKDGCGGVEASDGYRDQRHLRVRLLRQCVLLVDHHEDGLRVSRLAAFQVEV